MHHDDGRSVAAYDRMKTIIVVEDDPGIRETFTFVFDKFYGVSLYSSAEPLLTGNFELPDLFIIDRQLSGASGITLCRHLKERKDTSHIPVVLMSASPDIHRVAKEAGADNSIEKPFSIKSLRAIAALYTG